MRATWLQRSAVTAASIVLAVAACGKKEQAEAGAAARCGCRARKRRSCTSSTGPTTSPRTRSRTSRSRPASRSPTTSSIRTTCWRRELLAGNSGFDVVVPSASFLERQIKAGVFQKIDKSQLPNLKNMDPDIMKPGRPARPEQRVLGAYLWGTTGIGYNEDKIKKILGERAAGQLELHLTIRSSRPSSRTAASRCSTRPMRSSRSCSRGWGAIRTARRKRT